MRLPWVGPGTRKIKTHPLPDELTPRQRKDAAIEQSHKLQGRKLELRRGRHRRTAISIPGAVDRYFEAVPLSAGTLARDRRVTNHLIEWCKTHGIKEMTAFTRGRVREFSLAVTNMRSSKVKAGAVRGTRYRTKSARSASTINRDLARWAQCSKSFVGWN
jgi:hypothetical protein